MPSDSECRQSKLMELFSPRFDPILALLSLYLGIGGLSALYQVSRTFYGLKEHLQKSYFNINKQLSDFVVYPDMFRSQLGKYNALISGGFALNFFGSGHWKVPNLDVFIEAGTYAVEFINYPRRHEGYETMTKDNLNDETVSGRFVLVKSTRPDRKLRVIRTNGPPVHTILGSAYTTASVNLITWNKAYSVFPRQTLVHHKLYPLRPLDNDFGSVLSEYSKQGWTTRDILWPESPGYQVHTIKGTRRVGDSLSLVVPLDTGSVQQASTPDLVIEYAQFAILTQPSPVIQHGLFPPVPQNQPRQDQFPQIQVLQLKSPALRHGYTTTEPWRTYVIPILRRWTWVELYKLEPAERPQRLANDIPHHSRLSLPEEFSMPETWDYADDQMPIWYLEWEQMSKNDKPVSGSGQRRRG